MIPGKRNKLRKKTCLKTLKSRIPGKRQIASTFEISVKKILEKQGKIFAVYVKTEPKA